MTSGISVAEPVTVGAVVTALIGESDDRAAVLAARLAAWREGYERGFLAGAEAGRGAAAAEEAAQRREAAGLVAEAADIARNRWMLRGEHRTRGTFARPHPGDFPGRGAA